MPGPLLALISLRRISPKCLMQKVPEILVLFGFNAVKIIVHDSVLENFGRGTQRLDTTFVLINLIVDNLLKRVP